MSPLSKLLPVSEKQIDRALDIAERAVAAFEHRNRLDEGRTIHAMGPRQRNHRSRAV